MDENISGASGALNPNSREAQEHGDLYLYYNEKYDWENIIKKKGVVD